MGSRCLRHWLTHPLRERAPASAAPRGHRRAARAAASSRCARRCAASATCERITARIALRQVRPRELAGLRATLAALPALRRRGAAAARALLDAAARARWRPPPDIADALRAIADEPAVLLRDGGVIAAGVDAELDELRGISQNCDAYLLDLEAARAHAHRHRQPARAVQQGARLLHRGHGLEPGQGARRLPAPADAEERRALHHARAEGLRGQGAVGAGARAGAREVALRAAARRAAAAPGARCRRWPARWPRSTRWPRWPSAPPRSDWCRPEFVPYPCIDIEAGRHPVVEARLRETGGGDFIANDCRLDATHAHARHHRPQHGRQEHLHAPGGADRAAGGDGLLRAGRGLPAGADRRHPHPHRRGRRPGQCADRPSWSR